MEPNFKLILQRKGKTAFKLSVFESLAFDFAFVKSDKDLYRVMLDRSWIGGKREQATFFELNEVLSIFVMLVFKKLNFSIPEKIFPGDYPKNTKVKLYFDDPSKSSIVTSTRTKPFQNKIGVWYTFVMGVRDAVKLKDLEIII